MNPLGEPRSPDPVATAPKPAGRVVVVGAGFGGLEVARQLGKAGLPVTLVDRQNHHLFQPLLYQCATAALPATAIAEPIRRIMRRYRGVVVTYGEVVEIVPGQREVVLGDGERLGYDILVLAAGARTSYFGNDEWAEFACGLKSVEDAAQIRSRLLTCFELAERMEDEDERRRLMTVAIVGGGPTGVELAGSLAELTQRTLADDFRRIAPANARIVLMEGGPRLLPPFSETGSDYARERLEALGVEVRTGRMVDEVGPRGITVGEEEIPAGLVIWAAGVSASPLAGMLGVETLKDGRVPVDTTLAVEGLPGVFALGDVAAVPDGNGGHLPGLAQVARQQGRHLGGQLAGRLRDSTPIAPFAYRSRGDTAIIGRNAAIFRRGDRELTGWLAWLSWTAVHVYLLVGFQNSVEVSLKWLWRYVTFDRGARLIDRQVPLSALLSGRPPSPQRRPRDHQREDRQHRGEGREAEGEPDGEETVVADRQRRAGVGGLGREPAHLDLHANDR